VTHSAEDRMVVGVYQGVTFIDQDAPVLAHVLVRPNDVVLRTDLRHPEGVLQVILEEDMAVADLEATPFAPAVPAHVPSPIHVHAQCRTQATQDILEAVADQSVGQEEVAAVMTSGIVDQDHLEPDDMASGKISIACSELIFSRYSCPYIQEEISTVQASCIVLLSSNHQSLVVESSSARNGAYS